MKSFLFIYLIQKAVIRIRDNEREKRTIKPLFKKKKLKREREVVSNSIDPKI
jgi:hypothetical protein